MSKIIEEDENEIINLHQTKQRVVNKNLGKNINISTLK
jgi:hypothetical protein